ncbi:MAG: hypothetical protein WKG07_46835 [Hymenobacter sp.]
MPQTAEVAGLEKRLFLKERELGALLEITQAITQDSAEADLYKIYQFTLIGQLGVRRLALYVLEEGAFQAEDRLWHRPTPRRAARAGRGDTLLSRRALPGAEPGPGARLAAV